jgi:hypothetical protein
MFPYFCCENKILGFFQGFQGFLVFFKDDFEIPEYFKRLENGFEIPGYFKGLRRVWEP